MSFLNIREPKVATFRHDSGWNDAEEREIYSVLPPFDSSLALEYSTAALHMARAVSGRAQSVNYNHEQVADTLLVHDCTKAKNQDETFLEIFKISKLFARKPLK